MAVYSMTSIYVESGKTLSSMGLFAIKLEISANGETLNAIVFMKRFLRKKGMQNAFCLAFYIYVEYTPYHQRTLSSAVKLSFKMK